MTAMLSWVYRTEMSFYWMTRGSEHPFQRVELSQGGFRMG
jgi:hypothetical protein